MYPPASAGLSREKHVARLSLKSHFNGPKDVGGAELVGRKVSAGTSYGTIAKIEDGNTLTLTAPSDPNVCPPGHYMLFLIDQHGTPSLASIVAINPAGCTSTLTIPLPAQVVSDNGCAQTIRLTANGGTPGLAYNWTVNGSSAGTGPTIDVTVRDTAPTLQVRVEQSASCGVSSTFTTYFPSCTYTSRGTAANGKP